MSKFTPGPWASASRQGSNWDLVVYKPGTSLEICQMFHDFTKGNEIGEANAKLVAAAPELLEALKAVRSQVCGDVICSQIDAAIAKAEGK